MKGGGGSEPHVVCDHRNAAPSEHSCHVDAMQCVSGRCKVMSHLGEWCKLFVQVLMIATQPPSSSTMHYLHSPRATKRFFLQMQCVMLCNLCARHDLLAFVPTTAPFIFFFPSFPPGSPALSNPEPCFVHLKLSAANFGVLSH